MCHQSTVPTLGLNYYHLSCAQEDPEAQAVLAASMQVSSTHSAIAHTAQHDTLLGCAQEDPEAQAVLAAAQLKAEGAAQPGRQPDGDKAAKSKDSKDGKAGKGKAKAVEPAAAALDGSQFMDCKASPAGGPDASACVVDLVCVD